jgi:prophage tail gpP-like protein
VPFLAHESDPERETIALRLGKSGLELRTWTAYSFGSDFLQPSDGWEFTVPEEGLDDRTRTALGMVGPIRALGGEVSLAINGNVQSTGYIESIGVTASRSSGAEWTISGKDRLGQAIDSHVDPTLQFKAGVTLAELLKALFTPFGWKADDDFEIDNTANRNAKTGIRGVPFTKGGKKKGPRPLKSFVLHQLKPQGHEGVFAFAARVAERHGLWIRSSADGRKLIVGKPEFDQAPAYALRRARDGQGTNIIAGSVHFDMADQPTVIVADGFGGGGEFGASRLRAIASNPAFYTTDVVEALKPYAKYKDAHRIDDFRAVKTPYALPRCRPLYLHDNESQTQEQLDAFVHREMSLRLRKSLTCDYVVEGHGQLRDGVFTPWDIDTTVDVDDDLAGLHERMYVLGRRFEKSRGSGTTTRLHLIRLHSIAF